MMKTLSMILMGCSLLTLLSFNIPTEEKSEEYLPIDTTLGGIESEEVVQLKDFDSETF
jgi:hypothetical protein